MAKAMKKVKGSSKAKSKGEIYAELAERAELSRKQVGAVFEGLGEIIQRELTRGPKVFAVPGLMKITVVIRPATKARKGINPFTGQEMMFKAKPARKVVKIRPLKNLKNMVG